MRTEIDLNESEIDLNEREHFLKVNLVPESLYMKWLLLTL